MNNLINKFSISNQYIYKFGYIFYGISVFLILGVMLLSINFKYFVSNKDYMTYLKCHDLYAQFSSKTNMESFKCLKEISDYKTNPYVSMVKGWLHFQNILMGTSKDSKLDMKLARDIAEASKKSLSNCMPYILAGWLDLLSKDFVNTEKNARKAPKLVS